MVKTLNANQIKRINTAIKSAGYQGRAFESGGNASIRHDVTNAEIYFSSKFPSREITIELSSPGIGAGSIAREQTRIKIIQTNVKLAKKIDKIING